jgi:hypothetical protein
MKGKSSTNSLNTVVDNLNTHRWSIMGYHQEQLPTDYAANTEENQLVWHCQDCQRQLSSTI